MRLACAMITQQTVQTMALSSPNTRLVAMAPEYKAKPG